MRVENKKVFDEVDSILRDVREVGQIHCVITGQCLMMMIMMVIIIIIIIIITIIIIIIIIINDDYNTFAIVRYLFPAQKGETPPETSI